MMGRRRRDQGKLFYEFKLDDRIPGNHLLRRMNVFVAVALANLHDELAPYYSDIGRPSVDPELIIRMLIVGYCYGIRSERRLVQEVTFTLAFAKLDLDDEIPHHSTFSTNRLGRFRESNLPRRIAHGLVGDGNRPRQGARVSPSMPASWRRTPAAITARRRLSWTGPRNSARPRGDR